MAISAANAILAKSRAKYGRRLTTENYHELYNCQTVTEVAGILKSKTDYSKALKGLGEGTVHRGQLEAALRTKLFEEITSLSRYQSTLGDDFSDYIIIKSEISQIIIFLQLLLAGRPEEYLFSLPAYFSKRSSIDLLELSRVRSAKEFFRAMEHSRYKKAMAPFKVQENKLDFTGVENALYRYFYEHLWQLIEAKAGGAAKRELRELIGAQIDLYDFAHIYRLKRYFDAPPDYIRSILLNDTYLISKAVLEELISAPDSNACMSIFSGTQYGKFLNKIDYFYIDDLVSRIKYMLAKKYIRFSSNPSVVMMSYVILLETETEDIINIIESVRYKLPPDEIARIIIAGKDENDEGGSSDWQ